MEQRSHRERDRGSPERNQAAASLLAAPRQLSAAKGQLAKLVELQLRENGQLAVDVPQCPVCWEEFSEERGRLPRLLGCGHTICESCIINLPVCQGLAGPRSFACPECRNFSPWHGLAALPKNYALLRILSTSDTFSNPKQQRAPSPKQKLGGGAPSSSAAGGAPSFFLAAGGALPLHPLRLPSVVDNISSMFSRISILLGVLLGLTVFAPLCFFYMLLGWWVAFLTVVVFFWLSMAAIGFGVAGLFTFLCTYWVYLIRLLPKLPRVLTLSRTLS